MFIYYSKNTEERNLREPGLTVGFQVLWHIKQKYIFIDSSVSSVSKLFISITTYPYYGQNKFDHSNTNIDFLLL